MSPRQLGDTTTLAGHFTLNKRFRQRVRGQPRHQCLAHQDLAQSLLIFALKTVIRGSREIGSLDFITHPTSNSVRAFYRRRGFQALPSDPRGAVIVRVVALEVNDDVAAPWSTLRKPGER